MIDGNNEYALKQAQFFADKYGLELDYGEKDIYFIFSGYDDEWECSKEDIIFYHDNYNDSLETYNDTTIRTGLCSQTILDACTNYYYPAFYEDSFRERGYEVCFIQHPFYWVLWNLRERNYNDNISPIGFQYGIEFRYDSHNAMLSIEEEYEIINRILFFENRKYRICLRIGKIINVYAHTYWYEDLQEIHENIENATYEISALTPYTILNEMLTKAMDINYPEIKYLFYYKILEHVAPVVAKQKSFTELSELLKSSRGISIDTFLTIHKVIIENQGKAIHDSEIPKLILKNCVDFSLFLDKLPDSVLNYCKTESGFKVTETPCISDSRYNKFVTSLAACLYSTRNEIVHAKFNYNTKGNECPPEDYNNLLEFMDCLCCTIIDWNNNQKPELRIE